MLSLPPLRSPILSRSAYCVRGCRRSFAPASPLPRPLPQRLLREGEATVLSHPPLASPVLSRAPIA